MSKSNKYVTNLDTDLITLRALVAIADEGSFSAAAKKVGRTQAAVSTQISKLEDRIEAKLFDRTSRSVVPTDAGEELIAYARRIIKLANEAMLSISAPETSEVLRIGFAEYLAPSHLSAILERFSKAHPDVELKLNLGIGIDLHKQMTDGGLDIVVAGPEYDGGQILVKEQLVWVASHNYQPPERVSLVLMPAPCGYRKAAFDSLTEQNIPFKVGMEANSIQAVRTAVTAGLGVSVLARAAVNEELQVLDNVYPKLPKTSLVAYTAADAPESLVESFLTFLMDRLSSHHID